MSVCRLMIEDYKHKYGQYEGTALRYDVYDLEKGIEYAEWLIEEGLKIEPFFNINLKSFIKWAKKKLGGKDVDGLQVRA